MSSKVLDQFLETTKSVNKESANNILSCLNFKGKK